MKFFELILTPYTLVGHLFFGNKNTGQYLEFIVHYHDDCMVCSSRTNSTDNEKVEMFVFMPNIISHAVSRFDEVDEYADKGILHDRQFFLGDDWQCDYCQWSETCWEGYKGEVERRTANGLIDNEAMKICEKKHKASTEIKMHTEKEAAAKKEMKAWLLKKGFKKAFNDKFTVSLSVYNRNGKQSETLRITPLKKKEEK